MGQISHASQHAAHVSKAGHGAGHWVVAMDLILQVDETLVLGGDKGFEDRAHRHDSITDGDLALLAREAGQILRMHVV